MAPPTVDERHRIWLRLCQTASFALPAVQAAHVPSDAIPLDAPDTSPQSAADFISAIPAADLPADPAQAQEIRDLLTDLQRVISLHKFDVNTVDPAKHGYFRIDTGDAEPYWESQHRLSHHEQELLHERIHEYDAADITEPGTGPWASNPLFVPKKDGDTRLYIDMRGVNSKSRKDRWPLPRAEDLIAEARDAKFFTTIDLKSAFDVVLLHPEDRHKTCFYAGRLGFRQYKCLSMGLATGQSHFQRLADSILGDLLDPDIGRGL
jgi:hypothetical protein